MSVQAINPQVPTYLATTSQKPKRYPWHSVASLLLPGTGQFIKGDNRKGKIDLGVQIGLFVAPFIAGIFGLKKIVKTPVNFEKFGTQHNNLYQNMRIFSGVIVIASIVNHIQSAVDAYSAAPVKESEKT